MVATDPDELAVRLERLERTVAGVVRNQNRLRADLIGLLRYLVGLPPWPPIRRRVERRHG